MEKRKVLFFKKEHVADNLCSILQSNQWDVYICNRATDARYLMEKHRFFTAVALADECRDEYYLHQLKTIFRHSPAINWIMILPPHLCIVSGSESSEEQKLIVEYCYDYHSLPIDSERLLFVLGHAYGMAEITCAPYEQLNDYPTRFGIIGKSPVMDKLLRQIHKASKEDCPVLIEGETGTGKELIANAIHHNSSRSDHPIITVNCGAIPKDLVQAELFGYEKGAFTGAYKQKIGRIESAQGGTLFLDEIGDLPLDQQVNLLRFLEEKTIVRVGGIEQIKVDTRIIAATHIDLSKAVKEDNFREDLYYRLCVLQLHAPPLRERENDVELLAWYFFHKFSASHPQKAKGFSLNTLNVMRQYSWPGNIRELYNTIQQAIVMSDNRLLTPADLNLERRTQKRHLTTLDESRSNADQEIIQSTLRHTNYNMTQAAKMLGVSRVTLYRQIDKYKLSA